MKNKIRQLELYHIRRFSLIALLGDKCAICGNTWRLEIDHINGRDYSARKLNSLMRVKRYEQEHKEGKLRVLCSDCNKRNVPAPKDDIYYGGLPSPSS